MKMFKTIPLFILLFSGNLCNTQDTSEPDVVTSPTVGDDEYILDTSPSLEMGTQDHVPGLFFKLLLPSNPESVLPSERSLPTLVVAGVSIALVLLCILIVSVFWYAWKKSQEGSIELNPIPYGEPGVSLRNLSVPENQQGWHFERAVQ